MARIPCDNHIFTVLDTASGIPTKIGYFIPERLEERLALESVPEVRMLISQLHPPSQAAIPILFVFFQQFLPSPHVGFWIILPGQVRNIQQGTKNDADGAGLM